MTDSVSNLYIGNLAVIGAGTMGGQIAARSAIAGKNVTLYDALEGATERCLGRIENEIMPALAETGQFSDNAEIALGRIRFAHSLHEAVAGAQLVIEAVREELETKRQVFADLSAHSDAILATNSSSLPSSLLAESVADPSSLLNMHFFAPIWIRTMLEVMSCGQTSNAVLAAAMNYGRDLKLTTAAVRGESKGFIINRIWRAVKRESLRVVDEGVADPEDVDRLWMLFFQTEFPPFGVMDMVGLDVVEDIESSYQAVTLDPTDLPSPTLRSMVQAGLLGEKSGKGFYNHPDPAHQQDGFLLESDIESNR
ncbi:3-hydroxyacyl-CoA dehydrogenase NAD-binding domain-containing protein [soil metagenome]